ncbi:lactonase family protein [Sphingobacterium sp. LRF_L2]|uniref:lactonase family protein n=1 Tax=Sphingobacterium sp. LRF_L2 TaxID=3369421 RepID=UPI003F6432B7
MRTLSIFLCTFWTVFTSAQEVPLFIGTYTSNGSQGIYFYRFNPKNGEATLDASTATIDPSFLARSNDGNTLYAVNETGDSTASLSSFTFDGDALSFLNSLTTEGSYPCHVSIGKRFPIAVVSNYGGGSLSVYELDSKGGLSNKVQHIQQNGTGPDKERQEASHVHSAFFSPDGKRIYVQNLGTDKITIYGIEKNKNGHKLVEEQAIVTPAGGGPRHIVLDPKEKNLYVLLEMTAEIAHYKKNGKDWKLQETISINDDTFAGKNGAAEIKFSPDQKFIYASNRGDANSISLFRVNASGKLDRLHVYPTKGEGPRNFNIAPGGRYLLVANQSTDNITVFERDVMTGELKDAGKEIVVPTPVCVTF